MTSCGKPSSRSCLSNRRSRGVVGHAWTPGRPSRASSSCSRAASRGRCSPGRWAAGPARPAGGGCATGRRPGCGDACTGSCSTALAKPIGSTGRGRARTRRACPQKGGRKDRQDPDGSRRAGLEAPPCFRPQGRPAHGSAHRGQRPRLEGLRGDGGRRRAGQAPRSWPTEETPGEAAGGQRLRLPSVQGSAPEARHQGAHRPARGGLHIEKLGRHRWVVGRTLAWLARYRRLSVRYERRADIHEAFLHPGCSPICLSYLS